MVSFSENPVEASGQDNSEHKSTEASPQTPKQIESFFEQLSELLNTTPGELTEEAEPIKASTSSEFVELSKQQLQDPIGSETASQLESLLELLSPDQTEPVTASQLESLLEHLEPDQTEPEAVAKLAGLLEQLAADRTEPETEAKLIGLPEPRTDELPPEAAIKSVDELEVSRLYQLNAELNQKLNQLQEQLNASSQPTSLLRPVMADLPDHKVAQGKEKDQRNRLSLPFWRVGWAILGLVLIVWGIYQNRSRTEYHLKQKVAQALASAPELAVYRLEAGVSGRTLQLTGKLPNRNLRSQAEQIAQSVAPGFKLDNDIIVVDGSVAVEQVAAEVQRVAIALNQIKGISISARFAEGKATLEGIALQPTTIENITKAFKQIPGVKAVSNKVTIQPSSMTTRIYFNPDSARVKPLDIKIKIAPIEQLIQQYPSLQLKIIGHSYSTENANVNLGLERAKAVQTILEDRGIDRRRLQAIGREGSPSDVAPDGKEWLSRCVLFEVVPLNTEPTVKNKST